MSYMGILCLSEIRPAIRRLYGRYFVRLGTNVPEVEFARLSGRKIVDSVPPRKTLREYPLTVFCPEIYPILKKLVQNFFLEIFH